MNEKITIKLTLAHAERLSAALAEYLEFLRNVQEDALVHGEEIPEVMTLAGRRYTADHVHTLLVAALSEEYAGTWVGVGGMEKWQSN